MAEHSKRRLGRTDIWLSELGFGGGPAGWLQSERADDDVFELVEAAWSHGIRYFDTAPYYGYGASERRLGAFLRVQDRSAFVVSTKVGRRLLGPSEQRRADMPFVFDYSADATLRSIEASCERLGLQQIDIALIHDIDTFTHGDAQPMRFREALEGAHRALDDLRHQGAVRAIGLGVNEWAVCESFAREVDIDCILLAGRHTLLERSAQRRFVPFCKEKGIGLIAGGPYNSGILASGAVKDAKYDYARADPEIVARVRQIEAVCNAFGVSLPGAGLAYCLRPSVVASAIPGVSTLAELDTTARAAAEAVSDNFWPAVEEADPLGS